jgi:hypothetical protein
MILLELISESFKKAWVSNAVDGSKDYIIWKSRQDDKVDGLLSLDSSDSSDM